MDLDLLLKDARALRLLARKIEIAALESRPDQDTRLNAHVAMVHLKRIGSQLEAMPRKG